MKLLLIGCTGFIGRELIPQLLKTGHDLVIVTRKNPGLLESQFQAKQCICLKIDPSVSRNWQNGPLKDALKDVEGVINLAGEPIAEKRWTQKQCKEIENSRLASTKGLIEAMTTLKKPPRVFINASAIGYYGTSLTNEFNENSSVGSDFLASLCQQWESIALEKPRSTKLVLLRIGIVLGKEGGALGKMLPIFRAGLGGPIGDGKQWMSWIHREDLCQIMLNALMKKSWQGVINAVAPNPVSMKEFTATLGNSLGRPSLLPVPGTLLKLLLGDGARVVLEGQKVKSIRLDKLGFKFKYDQLETAINAAIHSGRSSTK